jgi:hypothetical protein
VRRRRLARDDPDDARGDLLHLRLHRRAQGRGEESSRRAAPRVALCRRDGAGCGRPTIPADGEQLCGLGVRHLWRAAERAHALSVRCGRAGPGRVPGLDRRGGHHAAASAGAALPALPGQPAAGGAAGTGARGRVGRRAGAARRRGRLASPCPARVPDAASLLRHRDRRAGGRRWRGRTEADERAGGAAGAGQAAVTLDAAGVLVVRSRYLASGYWRRPAGDRGRRSVEVPGRPRPGAATAPATAAHFGPDGELRSRRPQSTTRSRVRGYRVELREVEAALRGLPGVREAAVVAQAERDEETALAGFVAGPRRSPTGRRGANCARSWPRGCPPGRCRRSCIGAGVRCR